MTKSRWHNHGLVALLLPALLQSCDSPKEVEYGLPVKLGLDVTEVRNALGQPTEGWKKGEMGTLEWYYPHGIIAEFEHDKLASISLVKDTVYLGFIPYAGTILNGIKLTDSKATILSKLGSPSKIETADLPEGADPDKPVKFALDSKYYWKFKDYEAKAIFLNQARAMETGMVWTKDTLTEFTVQKFGRMEAGYVGHDH